VCRSSEDMARVLLELNSAVAEAADSERRRIAAGAPFQEWPLVPPPSTPPPQSEPARAAPASSTPRVDLGWVAQNYYEAKLIPCTTPACAGRAVRFK